MKNQALFSLKDKSKKLKCRLLQFLFGALMVNYTHQGLINLSNMDSLLNFSLYITTLSSSTQIWVQLIKSNVLRVNET